MIARGIRYIAPACILFLIYIFTPMEWIANLVANVSFDKKIDPESMPYLRILYNSIMIIAISMILTVPLCANIFPKTLKIVYRFMDKISSRRLLVIVCLIAVGIRVTMFIAVKNEQVSDFQEYHEFAQNLASGNGYIRNGQPTAWFPVGYPFFLSLLYRIFRPNPQVGQIANIFLTLVIIICTYITAKKLFSKNTAMLSALFVALWPNFIAYTGLLCSDLLFTALLIALLTVMISNFRHDLLRYSLTGLIFSMATLTRTGISLFIAVIIWYFFITRQASFRIFSIRLFIFAAITLIVLIPWWIRNYQVFERFIPLSTNGGFNFWLGNVQLAVSNDPSAMDAVWPDTEYGISSYGYKIGYDYIKNNPVAFLKQIPLKIINLFILDISGLRWLGKGLCSTGLIFVILIALSQIYYMIMLGLAGIGVFFTGKHFHKHYAHYLMTATFCYWIAIHCVFFGKDRYHLPLLPIIAVYSAYGISVILKKTICDTYNN